MTVECMDGSWAQGVKTYPSCQAEVGDLLSSHVTRPVHSTPDHHLKASMALTH